MPAFDRTLGVYGGTFDPVHFGHLTLAKAFQKTFALPEVRLIPTGEAPTGPPVRQQFSGLNGCNKL